MFSTKIEKNENIFAIMCWFNNFCKCVEWIFANNWSKFDQMIVIMNWLISTIMTRRRWKLDWKIKFDKKIRKHCIWIWYSSLFFAKTIWFFFRFENSWFENRIFRFRRWCKFSIVWFVEIFIVKLTNFFFQMCYFFIEFSCAIVFFVTFSIY